MAQKLVDIGLQSLTSRSSSRNTSKNNKNTTANNSAVNGDSHDTSYLSYLHLSNSIFEPEQASSPKSLPQKATPKLSPKKANKKKNYKLAKKFCDFEQLDAYVRTATPNGYKCTHNNGPVKCTICSNNYNKHEMDQRYWKCDCRQKGCELAWKVNKCLVDKESMWYLAQNGELHDLNKEGYLK